MDILTNGGKILWAFYVVSNFKKKKKKRIYSSVSNKPLNNIANACLSHIQQFNYLLPINANFLKNQCAYSSLLVFALKAATKKNKAGLQV